MILFLTQYYSGLGHSMRIKHIAEEKDIARYKITLLEKGSKKQYKERLLSIEKEFIEYQSKK